MSSVFLSSETLVSQQAAENVRAREIFATYQQAIYERTDRFFAGLMILQWFAGVAIATFVSPRAWIGLDSYIHPHIWAAIFLGALIAFVPACVAWRAPGHTSTRHLIAVCQMLLSALLIHLTGGRIETHFHVFGSLAFLAFYYDWRVLITATSVVLVDHLLRGFLWPESVYGTLTASPWRSFEHAGWVIFEDAFLILSIQQSLVSLRRMAQQKAALEQAHAAVEEKVRARTRELAETNVALSREIAEREALQRRFVETARRVGMAEVATSVLHNVGNVLTSVNVSATLASEKVQSLGVADLGRAISLIEEHRHDLAQYITEDNRGRHLPDFLTALGRKMVTQEEAILNELADLSRHIEHIKGVVAVQQSHAGATGLVELISIREALEDAIRINEASINRHGLEVVRDYQFEGQIEIEKHKLLQVLVNLVSNAKYALIEDDRDQPRIIVRSRLVGEQEFAIEVEDNGIGIAPENLLRIFEHGFTTRREGHGFGLHSAALAVQELGGMLTGESGGPGTGALFRLVLPLHHDVKEATCTT